jgi:hypothetical protein
LLQRRSLTTTQAVDVGWRDVLGWLGGLGSPRRVDLYAALSVAKTPPTCRERSDPKQRASYIDDVVGTKRPHFGHWDAVDHDPIN